MEYEKIWSKILNPKEEIKYEFSIGKKYRNYGLFVFGILGLLIINESWFIGILIILIAFCYFGWYLKIANIYAFSDKRVLIHKGWLSTHLISIDYEKITDIKIEEPFLDRIICKTGNLSINTAGTGLHEVILKHIEKPYEVKKKLDDIREK